MIRIVCFPGIAIWWLLPALLLGNANVTVAAATNREWGAEACGRAISIAMDKTNVLTGNPIRLEVAMRNVSSKDISLNMYGTVLSVYHLFVCDSNEKEVPLTRFG